MDLKKLDLKDRIKELEDNLMEEKETLRIAKESAEQLLEENKDFDEQLKNYKEIEKELIEAKKHTYIHETHHLYCQNGEMYFGFGDVDEEKWLVYNTDQLFKDLPFIINQVVKENKKMQDMYLDNIKDSLKKL